MKNKIFTQTLPDWAAPALTMLAAALFIPAFGLGSMFFGFILALMAYMVTQSDTQEIPTFDYRFPAPALPRTPRVKVSSISGRLAQGTGILLDSPVVFKTIEELIQESDPRHNPQPERDPTHEHAHAWSQVGVQHQKAHGLPQVYSQRVTTLSKGGRKFAEEK